ncbi:MAG TPA: type II/IV secretion system ATPase subunit, partial [Thermoplasmata archaeon]
KDLLYSRLVAQQDGSVDSHEVDIEADRLSEILSKYTAGYGILETLLEDDLVQDIFVDSPSSHAPVQVVLRSEAHQSVRQKCRTNVFLGRRDLKAIVSRVKLETGLPFSEANPVLEADLRRLDCRITIVGPPLSERGVAIAIRKHARNIWTMPSLIANDTLSPLLSAFLWACAIGRRTVLIAGSRGSGKTTLLGALMLEFPLTQRVVVIEDTPEIPTRRMQELGFDIQPLRFSQGGSRQNISADDALRVSLRMGESAIVVGEVRGQEARLLYESMRAGSAGSAVLGTIHGNSARGVLDRAIEDLGISERAFSSTDLIVVMGLLRAPDGSRFQRRISEVAEVRYEKSGISIAGLFSMENGSSCASPTSIFSDGCQTMKNIGQSLGCGSERMMAIVKARAHADQLYSELVNRQSSSRSPEEMRLRSNEVLTGLLFSSDDPETGLRRWREWFDAENGKVNSE